MHLGGRFRLTCIALVLWFSRSGLATRRNLVSGRGRLFIPLGLRRCLILVRDRLGPCHGVIIDVPSQELKSSVSSVQHFQYFWDAVECLLSDLRRAVFSRHCHQFMTFSPDVFFTRK